MQISLQPQNSGQRRNVYPSSLPCINTIGTYEKTCFYRCINKKGPYAAHSLWATGQRYAALIVTKESSSGPKVFSKCPPSSPLDCPHVVPSKSAVWIKSWPSPKISLLIVSRLSPSIPKWFPCGSAHEGTQISHKRRRLKAPSPRQRLQTWPQPVQWLQPEFHNTFCRTQVRS